MEYFLKLFTTFISGAVEIWAGVPTGMALGLGALMAGLMTGLGAVVSAVFVIGVGSRFRDWLVERFRKKDGEQKQPKGREKKLYQIWERYGVVGLGLMAPLLTGVPLGAAIGIVLGAPPHRLLVWMSAGAVLWTVLITLAAALGLAGYEALVD
jgi:uncharacterized membrane protein